MQRNAARAEPPSDAAAAATSYDAPAIVELGRLHELTLHDDKGHGGSDGFAFQRHPLVHTSR